MFTKNTETRHATTDSFTARPTPSAPPLASIPFAHAITAITSPKIMTFAIPAHRSIQEVFDSSCGMNGPPGAPKYSVDARYVPTAPATKPSRKTTGDITQIATMRGTTIDRTG